MIRGSFRPRVTVIGGGLAGIAAAEALALAEFEVTLMERGRVLGGRVEGWLGQDGRGYEHGVHAFWPNYVRLFALLGRAGIERDTHFQRSSGTVLVVGGEGRYEQRPLSREVSAPWHLLFHLKSAAALSWSDRLSVLRAGIEMLAFEHVRDYAEYDGVSFRGWLWSKGVSRGAYQRLFEPWVRALTFDSASRVSAAAVLSSFQHYLLRGQHDIEPYWLKVNPKVLFEGLHRHLKGLGVRIIYDAEVRKFDNGGAKAGTEAGNWHVHAAGYRSGSGVEREGPDFHAMLEIKEEEIADGQVMSRDLGNGWPRVHLRRLGNELRAFDATCTHARNATEIAGGKFRCPVHNSLFDLDGNPCGGLATERLTPLEVRQQQGGWIVGTREKLLFQEGDYVVSAVDISAFQRLVTPALLTHPAFRAIETLETSTVIVGRFWFGGNQKLVPWSSGVLVGDSILDAFFVLPFEPTGEAVVEAQAYLVRDSINLNDDSLRELFLRDLGVVLPSLKDIRPTHCRIQRYSNLFSLYEAGSDAFRPSTYTPIPNLFLAGDWVHVDEPVWNMERAVMTGTLAARAVIEAHGRNVDKPPIPLFSIQTPTPSEQYKRVQSAAQRVRNTSRWWRRARRADPRLVEPIRAHTSAREGRTQSRPRYRLRFRVRKEAGKPNEQLVHGSILFSFAEKSLKIKREGANIRVEGRFRVDLTSLNTRIADRDANLMSTLLNVQKSPYADVEIENVRPGSEPGTYDVELKVVIGTMSVSLPARAEAQPRSNGLMRLDVVIDVTPSTLGYDIRALAPVCSVSIENRLEITTTVGVPEAVMDEIGKPRELVHEQSPTAGEGADERGVGIAPLSVEPEAGADATYPLGERADDRGGGVAPLSVEADAGAGSAYPVGGLAARQGSLLFTSFESETLAIEPAGRSDEMPIVLCPLEEADDGPSL